MSKSKARADVNIIRIPPDADMDKIQQISGIHNRHYMKFSDILRTIESKIRDRISLPQNLQMVDKYSSSLEDFHLFSC